MNSREIITVVVKAIVLGALRYFENHKGRKNAPENSPSEKQSIDEGYGLG